MARDEEMGIEMIKQDALDKELEMSMDNAVDPLSRRQGASQGTWITRHTSMG